MSVRVSRFSNVELYVTKWLTTQCPLRQVFAGQLPEPWTPAQVGAGAIQVIRSPGSDDGITTQALIDLHCFGSDYANMWDVTKDAQEGMRALGQQAAVDGQLIDTVRTRQDPAFQPWSRDVPRTVSVYQVELRPVPSS